MSIVKLFRDDFFNTRVVQGVKRCRLSWLTNSALLYEPKYWVLYEPKYWGVGVAGSQPMSTAVHMEPKYTLKILLYI